MRLIAEVFGKAWMFEFQSAKLVDPDEGSGEEEEFDRAPVDPHSVGGGQIERGPGADSFVSDIVARRFGFNGSKS